MAIKLKTTTYTEAGGEIVYKTNQPVIATPFNNKCNTRFCLAYDSFIPVSGYAEKVYIEILVTATPPAAPVVKKVPLIYHAINLDGEQLARYVNVVLEKTNACCYAVEPQLAVLYNPRLNEAYVLNNNILPPIPQADCGC